MAKSYLLKPAPVQGFRRWRASLKWVVPETRTSKGFQSFVKATNINKKGVVSVRYQGGVPQIPGVVSPRYPNNTNIKKTNLNNVNRASRVLVLT